jgi:type IV pilus assembly protein PilB
MFEKIGEILVRKGYITQEQVRQAISQNYMGKRIGQVLLDLNLLSEDQLVEGLAEQLGVDWVSSERILLADEDALTKVSEEFAKANRAVPICIEKGMLVVAMADTDDLVVLDGLKRSVTMPIQARLGGERTIDEAVDRLYTKIRRSTEIHDTISKMEFVADPDADDKDGGIEVERELADSPVVRLVNQMLTQAIQERATDIHVEPQENVLRIRYRIDGVLMEAMSIPISSHAGIVSRIKIISKLNIAERRLTQDGRLSIKTQDKLVDVRVSILPTVFGEKVVLRLLDKSGFMFSLRNLGFNDDDHVKFSHWITQPYGMVIISGPTGSGKSTTLYAALSEVRSITSNITTVEDPVEYQVEGISQVQVREKIGLTFAASLRSILRQDPDTLLIGEIRDQETADIAIKFALTGHLVFTTLHANDAPSTITRYIDLGVPPFLVGSCLNLVMAQRLVRRICVHCKEERISTPEDWLAIHENPDKFTGKPIYAGKGCPHCRNSGYRGRTGIFEVLEVRQDIRRLIYDGASQERIREMAIKEHGMISLRYAGLSRAMDGITTLAEVKRATVEDF